MAGIWGILAAGVAGISPLLALLALFALFALVLVCAVQVPLVLAKFLHPSPTAAATFLRPLLRNCSNSVKYPNIFACVWNGSC